MRLIPFFAFSAVVVAAPKIQFAAPIFDFGRIKGGELVNHTFTFTNTGDHSLELTDVRPSCGCTTAGAYDRTVAPGKTGNIPIQFNSGNSSGTVGKTVIVLCNDPMQTNIVLQIKGTVWKPIEIMPAIVSFRESSDTETNETQRVQILSHLDEPLVLSPPECTNKAFQATLTTRRPGREYELAVTFLRPRNAAPITAPILLKTSSTNVPLITIPVFALVQPAVVVAPAQLTVPAGPLSSALQFNLNVRNFGSTSLVLSDPTIDAPGVEIQIHEVQPGQHFMLTANFPPGFQLPPGQPLEIRVKTNHPQFPLLKIPVLEGHSLAAALQQTEAAVPAAKQQ